MAKGKPRQDYRDIVRKIVRTELAEYDRQTAENMKAVVAAYDERAVEPLREWAALPWWRRLFTAPPTPGD